MAEERKKVWKKLENWYKEEVLCTDKNIQKLGKLAASGRLSLPEIVEVQREFQKRCKPISAERDGMFSYAYPLNELGRTGDPLWQEMMRVNVIATVAEMMELLETCPWKPWKTYTKPMQKEEVMEARLEIVDALCFLMNCWMLLGGDGEDLAHLYLAKMKENHRRQEEGY